MAGMMVQLDTPTPWVREQLLHGLEARLKLVAELHARGLESMVDSREEEHWAEAAKAALESTATEQVSLELEALKSLRAGIDALVTELIERDPHGVLRHEQWPQFRGWVSQADEVLYL